MLKGGLGRPSGSPCRSGQRPAWGRGAGPYTPALTGVGCGLDLGQAAPFRQLWGAGGRRAVWSGRGAGASALPGFTRKSAPTPRTSLQGQGGLDLSTG